MTRALRMGIVAIAVSVPACKPSCRDLEAEATQLKEELGACIAGETCVAIDAGNNCLVALACGFAVPASKRDEAQSRAQGIAHSSLDCSAGGPVGSSQCAKAECVAHGAPTCNKASGRCVFPGL